MSDRIELLKTLSEKENMLHRAEQEMSAWNNGKYKTSANAIASTVLVKTLRNEIEVLTIELKHHS